MNSLFKSEFKRQLTYNPLFWACVAIGICIALLAAWIEIQIELNTLEATLQQGDHLSYNTLLSVGSQRESEIFTVGCTISYGRSWQPSQLLGY